MSTQNGAVSLFDLPFLPPRKILWLFDWKVEEDADTLCRVALIISSLLFLCLTVFYIWAALTGCRKRSTHVSGGETAAKDCSLPESVRPSKLWTIHNKRYDLTPFIWAHPGGVEAIGLGQGRNCTEMYESYHSLSNENLVRATLKRYYVEDAPVGASDYAVLYDWQSTPFYDEIKRRARKYFSERRHFAGRCAPLVQWSQLVVCTIVTFIALRGFMCGHLFSMVLLPFFYWWGPSPFMHDAGHFALCTGRWWWVNSILGRLGMFHISLFQWQHWHNIGHHQHPNVPNKDPDLYHFSVSSDKGLPGFRSCLELRTLPEVTASGKSRQEWWHTGLWYRIPMATFVPCIVWDIFGLMSPNLDHSFMALVPYPEMSAWRLSGHSVGRCIVWWLSFIHPIVVNLLLADGWISGILWAVLFVATPWAVHGALFYVFTQFSHIQEVCFEINPGNVDKVKWHHDHPMDGPTTEQFFTHGGFNDRKTIQEKEALFQQETREPSEESNDDGVSGQSTNGRVLREWAIHQAEHAFDYAVDSRLWLHLSNGLNLQIVHHLFPQVAWAHYRNLTPMVKEVCEQFNVTYSSAPTFLDAARLHFKYLGDINCGEYASVWVQPKDNKHLTSKQLAVLDQTDSLWDATTNALWDPATKANEYWDAAKKKS